MEIDRNLDARQSEQQQASLSLSLVDDDVLGDAGCLIYTGDYLAAISVKTACPNEWANLRGAPFVRACF